MAVNADRERQAVELHLAGINYAGIARALGFHDRSGARKAVQRGLQRRRIDPGETMAAQTELARLDTMLTSVWTKARKGDLGAVDRVLRIEERRAAVLQRLGQVGDQGDHAEATGLSEFERRLADREGRRRQESDQGG